jgi:hypothetical protein
MSAKKAGLLEQDLATLDVTKLTPLSPEVRLRSLRATATSLTRRVACR